MLPAAFLTVTMPSATIHCAGDLSCADTHSSRFVPSKRTRASDGGAPHIGPGVTIFGSGAHTSVSSGLGPGEGAACDGDCAGKETGDWADPGTDRANMARNAAVSATTVGFMLRTYTGRGRRRRHCAQERKAPLKFS